MQIKDESSSVTLALRKRPVRLMIVALVLAGFVFLVWYCLWPVPLTRFRTTVYTHSLSFLVGEWGDSGGIFNSDTARVDLSLPGGVSVHSSDGFQFACEGGSLLKRVRMLNMSTAEGQLVSLDVLSSGKLRYALTLAGKDEEPFVGVQLDERSDISQASCGGGATKPESGEWRITSQAGSPLEFSVAFLQDEATGTGAGGSADPIPAGEREIPLAGGSSVVFQGESGPIGSKSVLRLVHSEKTVPLTEGLTLTRVGKAMIERLSYDSKSQMLMATLAGTTGKIEVESGGEEITESENRLPQWLGGQLAGNVITALATVIGAVLALLGVVWTIRANRDQQYEKIAADIALGVKRMEFDERMAQPKRPSKRAKGPTKR